jgi:hypothetical protein
MASGTVVGAGMMLAAIFIFFLGARSAAFRALACRSDAGESALVMLLALVLWFGAALVAFGYPDGAGFVRQ